MPDRSFEIFAAACELSGQERLDYLERACAGDAELRGKVERLLAQDAASVDFLGEEEIARGRERLGDVLVQGAVVAPQLAPDQRVGPFRILRLLGQGGMGIVYEAEQDTPRRRVALKVVRQAASSPERLRRFRRETELLGRLQHPGIARIYEAGTFDLGQGEQPYFALEYVDGVDLARYAKENELDLRQRLTLLAAVCDAVEHAHEQGVIHRDLKPENILVDLSGQPKVLDFGVARTTSTDAPVTTLVTEDGDLLGTIAYMAPEQLVADSAAMGPHTDVYALGVIAFELLTGRLPHDVVGLPIGAAIQLLEQQDAPALSLLRPELRGDVETIVGKALEKEPGRRYPSASALRADLRATLEERLISARPPSRLYRATKFVRRHRALVAGTVATLLALLAGLAVALVLLARENRLRETSEANARRAREGERRALGGVLQMTQSLLEEGRLGEALLSFRRISETAEGWTRDLVERALPSPLPARWAGAGLGWADEDRLYVSPVDGSGGLLVEVDTWRVLGEFPSEGAYLRYSTLPAHVWRSLVGGELVAVDPRSGDVRHRIRARSPEEPQHWFHFTWDDEGDALDYRFDADARRWRILRGETELGELQTGPLDEDAKLYFASEGSTVAAYANEVGRLWLCEKRSGALLGQLDGLRASSCGRLWVRPSGQEVVAFDASLRLVLVDVPSARVVRRYEEIVTSDCEGGALSPDGRYFAHARARRALEVWDLESGELVYTRELQLVEGVEHRLLFSPSSQRLLVVAPGADACILDLGLEPDAASRQGTGNNSNSLSYRAHSGYTYHIAIAPDGRTAVSSRPDSGVVYLWDLATGETLSTWTRGVLPPTQYYRGELLSFRSSGDAVLMTTPMPEHRPVQLVRWDLFSGEVEFEAPPEQMGDAQQHQRWIDRFVERAEAVPLQRLGRRAQVGADGRAWATDVWNRGAEEGERWSRLDPCVPRPSYEGLALSPDGARAAVGHENILSVHLLESGEELARFPGRTYGLAWSPDGRLLAAGGPGGRVRLYDGEFLCELLHYSAHADYVYSLAWTPDGTRLVTCGGDAYVRVWDARPAVEREADYANYLARVDALRGLDLEELRDRFERSTDVDERGALVRAALELRR